MGAGGHALKRRIEPIWFDSRCQSYHIHWTLNEPTPGANEIDMELSEYKEEAK